MTWSAVRRPGAWAIGAAPVAAAALLLSPHAPLTRAAGFEVTSPADGADEARQTVVRWSAAPGAVRYAVVVDDAPPAPGAAAAPGERLVVVDGREVSVSLGAATSGSPSSRGFHTVVVVPLDGSGRRLGEDVAVVHLRGAR